MSGSGLPSTRDVLCEHVYAVVQGLAPANATQITGMLIEGATTNQQLTELLSNKDLMKQRISQALTVLANNKDAGGADSVREVEERAASLVEQAQKEQIGEELFDKVAEIESELSAQITGMLLELDMDSIETLMNDSQALEAAVNRAKTEYLHTYHPGTMPSRQDLGDVIYDYVNQIHPDHASKITGMLLELDTAVLHQFLDNPSHLEERIEQAYKTVSNKS